MKKIISVLLSVIMLFSLIPASAVAADEKLIITVANDLHYNMEGANTTETYTEDYAHVPSSGQLRVESELVIDTFLEAVAENESQIVLLPGDIVDTGSKEELAYMAAKLTAFEKATGKNVYVVPGNHDYYGGATVDEIKNIFSDLGYSEAIAVDSASASYVAELSDDYRLIAIDSCEPGESKEGVTEERAEWIKAQAQQAEKDGKKTIAMMHHNLLDHFMFSEMLHAGSTVDSSLGLAEAFAEYNVKYTFVAHTHAHDIKSYTGKNGNTIYDVLTSSLNLYPVPYRNVTFGDEVKIETEYIEEVDMSSLEGIISDNCYNLAAADFQGYAKECSARSLGTVITSYITPARIKKLLKLDEETSPELCAIVDELVPLLKEATEMPLYTKDEVEAGKSIESLAKKIRLDLVKTDYKTFKELVAATYMNYVVGDENFGVLSTEYTLLSAVITTVINYVLKDVGAEEYAMVLDYLNGYFNLNIPVKYINYTGDAIERIKGIDSFVSALLNTVVLSFTTDEAPKDSNTTLPGYTAETENEKELSLWDKIVKFFLSFFDNILRIFGVGK